MIGDIKIDLDFDLAAEPPKTRQTSETYKHSAKIFLGNIDVRPQKITNTTMRIISEIKNGFALPEPGQQLRIRTQQQINLISIVMLIVQAHQKIDHLLIATYTLNREAFSVLTDLLRAGRIKKLRLFLASSYSFRDKDYYNFLKEAALDLSKKHDLHLSFAWLHLKITLAAAAGNLYQLEGSMNYSMNNMAEQILFENNPVTYAHDKNFIQDLVDKSDQKAVEIIC